MFPSLYFWIRVSTRGVFCGQSTGGRVRQFLSGVPPSMTIEVHRHQFLYKGFSPVFLCGCNFVHIFDDSGLYLRFFFGYFIPWTAEYCRGMRTKLFLKARKLFSNFLQLPKFAHLLVKSKFFTLKTALGGSNMNRNLIDVAIVDLVFKKIHSKLKFLRDSFL